MSAEIKQVGVVGAGTMGIGICEVAANHGQRVLLFDLNQEMAEKALSKMQERLKKRAFKGKIPKTK